MFALLVLLLLSQSGQAGAAPADAREPAQAVTVSFPEVVEPDPLIQGMIDQVDSDTVYSYTGGLSGAWPVQVGGENYTITSRYTYSGESIQKATQYVGEHLANLGLEVEYQVWETGGEDHPNVVGELPGLLNPDDIYIIGGHLDDVYGVPGADDNGSGSVATMVAADILTQYRWGCTLRFAFWTGEEQGLNGSEAYAQRAYSQGENILGYLNLDMIAWNSPNQPEPDIHLYYSNSAPGSQDLAELFVDVLDAYDLNLIPHIEVGSSNSDQGSFWIYGYPAILGIEYFWDRNPYYHTSGDNLEHIDLSYYTEFVRAALGTLAHMSNCLIPAGSGYLSGHVTSAGSGEPVSWASVEAEGRLGYDFSAATDTSGYYSATLFADTYTVTASAYGFLPGVMPGVEVLTDTLATVDFSLSPAPTYTVSGVVTEAGSGLPLNASLTFEGSPLVAWTDPSTGFYQAELPLGAYTIRVEASGHYPVRREIIVDQNQAQDFNLLFNASFLPFVRR